MLRLALVLSLTLLSVSAVTEVKGLYGNLLAPEDPLLTNKVESYRVDPTTRAAQVARFIVHFSSWGSVAHISSQPGVAGSPVARVYSTSDGPKRESSGTPYFYLCPEDPEVKDMMKDARVSLTMSLAQSPYCQLKNLDPEDPRCPQVVLTGTFVVLKNTTKEYQYAQEAMFTRHPDMRFWAKKHPWLTCKLKIQRVMLVDDFGGNKFPDLDLYYKVHPDVCSTSNPFLDLPYLF